MEQLPELQTDFERAQYLQDMLISFATGGGGDNDHYQQLRRCFLNNPNTKDLVPSLVRTKRDLSQFWQFIKHKLPTYAERRSLIWSEFGPLLEYLESGQRFPAQDSIDRSLEKLDSDGVQVVWTKALERKASDPEGAITAARTLVESVCKYILDDMQVEYAPDKMNLPELYNLTARALLLAPSQHTEQVFKQILGGCSAVVSGLGTLRNRLGDAHGKGKARVKPAPYHAELAVNLAGAMALFLIETFQARKRTPL